MDTIIVNTSIVLFPNTFIRLSALYSLQRAYIEPIKTSQQCTGDSFQPYKIAFPGAFDVERHNGIVQG